MAAVLLSVIFFLCASAAQASVSCISPTGQPVDYWMAIKFPKISTASNPNVQGGVAFAYVDNTMTTWQLFTNASVADPSASNPMANTLNVVYTTTDNSVAYGMYNDEPPNGSTSETYGHSKGFFALDSQTGYWLLHSVPKWPFPASQGYGYGDGQMEYGQSFMCVTFRSNQFDLIGTQLQYIYPDMYDSNIPEWMTSLAPNLTAAVNKQHFTDPGAKIAELVSLGSQPFFDFAKNKEWDQNLYEDLVTGGLQDGMNTETWQNGALSNKLPSFCPPSYTWTVQNIQAMSFQSFPGGDEVKWANHQDHSKWGLTLNTQYVCIGGINRQVSQQKRGGGTMCLNTPTLWPIFNAIVAQIESC